GWSRRAAKPRAAQTGDTHTAAPHCAPASRRSMRAQACGGSDQASVRLPFVASDIDACSAEGAVRLLGRRLDREWLARLAIGLAPDLITHDRCIRTDDDLLLAVLVLDEQHRPVDALDKIADRAVGHGAIRGAVPGTVTVALPALRGGEDVHFDGLLGAISLWHGPAADVVAFLDLGDRGLVNGDDRRVVGELDRRGCAVRSFDEQNVAVDSLDRAPQPLRLLGVSRGSNKSSHDTGG